jgi:hypothetical protein
VAESVTIGLKYSPRWASGLQFSVDYYDIELTDAINTASAQSAADTCVDLPTLDNDFCGLQTREPGVGGVIDFVQQPLNVAKFTTEGYDFEVRYQLNSRELTGSDYGLFSFRLLGNKLEDLTFINLPARPPDEDLGQGQLTGRTRHPSGRLSSTSAGSAVRCSSATSSRGLTRPIASHRRSWPASRTSWNRDTSSSRRTKSTISMHATRWTMVCRSTRA